MATTAEVETECSGCMQPVVLDLVHGVAHVRFEGTDYTASIWGDEDLWTWDCPIPMCNYADSFDPNYSEERGY